MIYEQIPTTQAILQIVTPSDEVAEWAVGKKFDEKWEFNNGLKWKQFQNQESVIIESHLQFYTSMKGKLSDEELEKHQCVMLSTT